MRVLPDWVDRGAIIGMQGGTQAVRDKLATLEKAGVPLAGFWLQDWVGQRTTSFGKQLWWNWTLDEARYPGWDQLRADLAQRKIRLLGYANTMLVDLDDTKRRSLISEARERGYLVKGADGQPLMTLNTSFSAAHVDLANPAAYAWLKNVLKNEMLAKGFSGWMADFAEGLPFDAQTADGKPGAVELHNSWPERWAQLNHEMIDENGLANEAIAFHRSGWSRSPKNATLFWLGDQLVDWGPEDGLASALTGLLTGGLSGFAINHSDIGGYTTITSPVLNYKRSKELFMRWAEFAAFTPVFRTHEGNRPEANWQFDSDAETLAHFTRMSQLFGCWRNTRQQLFLEAQNRGLPVNRLMWLHYPDDQRFIETTPTQMLVGADILVAPVMTPKATTVSVSIPDSDWQHLWTGEAATKGTRDWPAPIGQPAVFVRTGSAAAHEFRRCVLGSDFKH
jgi:alpha-glucosidase